MKPFLKIAAPPEGMPTYSDDFADDLARVTPGADGYSVEDFLKSDGSYRIEFVDGWIEIPPWVTGIHQELVGFMSQALREWTDRDGAARTVQGPFFIRLSETLWRNPDVSVMLGRHRARRHPMYWEAADLVVEIVGDDNPEHDRITKRAEYADAGIPEYWIVDPADESVTVLTLPASGDRVYAEHSRFVRGQIAAGRVLNGFAVDVSVLFDTAREWA